MSREAAGRVTAPAPDFAAPDPLGHPGSPEARMAAVRHVGGFRDRYAQCDDTCTTDCGACKGGGRP